jgi:hypothetical protein
MAARSPVRKTLGVLGHRALILGFTLFAVFPFYCPHTG